MTTDFQMFTAKKSKTAARLWKTATHTIRKSRNLMETIYANFSYMPNLFKIATSGVLHFQNLPQDIGIQLAALNAYLDTGHDWDVAVLQGATIYALTPADDILFHHVA